jgi:hypothetical protein
MRRREALRRLGGAASIARALRADAQQSAVPVIGCFGTASPNPSASRLHAFHQVLGNRPRRGLQRHDRIPLGRGSLDRMPGLIRRYDAWKDVRSCWA